MKIHHAMRSLLLATALLGAGAAAFAESSNDVYTRLQDMRAKLMQQHSGGMVSRAEYLDMVGKAWDMKAEEMQVRNGKMTPEQLKELEKLLGRMLGS